MYAAGPHPRLVLPPRGPAQRGRDPHLPADRPAAAPVVRQGPAQRGPGRRDRPGARPGRTRTTWSRSTPRRCPPSSPACRSPARSARTRVAHIDGQWVAFPTHEELERATFDMVVAGRVAAGRRRRDHDGRGRGHRAHRRADRRRRHRADRGGRRRAAWRRPSRPSASCAGRRPSWPRSPPSRSPSSRSSSTTRTTSTTPSPRPVRDEVAEALTHRRQGGARGGPRPDQGARRTSALGRRSSRAARRRSAPRFRSLTKKEVRARVLRDQVRIDGRGPRDIRPLTAEVERAAAGARLGAVRARRDPDPGRHHAEHAAHGADAGHALAGEAQALHAQLQLPAVLDR